jgi:hypothetical protein
LQHERAWALPVRQHKHCTLLLLLPLQLNNPAVLQSKGETCVTSRGAFAAPRGQRGFQEGQLRCLLQFKGSQSAAQALKSPQGMTQKE